jgi:Arylsulfotransferase (ASST)
MDMSKIVTGGKSSAQVTGLIIQELDASKNVIFQWRSWDHFQISDSSTDLTTSNVDYVHGNAIEVDFDNNLLISSRNMDEITKIDRQTGNIIWRLGVKKNQFTFLNGIPQFFEQHDIRRLPNGNITLFNNRADHVSVYSAAEEYTLDENKKTASLFWQFRNTPDTYSLAMGDVQRLPNGNTMIGWGSGFPTLTEVKPGGLKAFELTLASPNTSYRAFRFPWHGSPETPPDLVVQTDGAARTLYFSWNGATEISSYQIYGGNSADHLSLLVTQAKTGFETIRTLADPLNIVCYFQVVPVDQQGNAMRASNVIYTGAPCNSAQFLPMIVAH